MNLRGKKENLAVVSALSDKTNNVKGNASRKKGMLSDKSAKNSGKMKENRNVTQTKPVLKNDITKYLTQNVKKSPPLPNRTPLSESNENVPLNHSVVLSDADNVFAKPGAKPIEANLKPPARKKKLVKKRQTEKKGRVPSDTFGFNSSASDLEQDVEPCQTELTEFDPSKPFRVALYVKPSKKLRLDATLLQKCLSLNPHLNASSISMVNSVISRSRVNQTVDQATLQSPKHPMWKMPFSSTPKELKTSSLVQSKLTDTWQQSPKRKRICSSPKKYNSFFETPESSGSETSTNKTNASPELNLVQTSNETKLNEVDDTVQPTAFRRPNRRSYVKKPKPVEPVEEELSSDEIMKSIAKSKKKPKAKKTDKQDKDFEVWSRSMNNQFEEVDKFEISFD